MTDEVCLYLKPLKSNDILDGGDFYTPSNDITVTLEGEEQGTIDCKEFFFKPDDAVSTIGLKAVACKPSKIDQFGFAVLLEGALKDNSSLSAVCTTEVGFNSEKVIDLYSESEDTYYRFCSYKQDALLDCSELQAAIPSGQFCVYGEVADRTGITLVGGSGEYDCAFVQESEKAFLLCNHFGIESNYFYYPAYVHQVTADPHEFSCLEQSRGQADDHELVVKGIPGMEYTFCRFVDELQTIKYTRQEGVEMYNMSYT